MNSAAPAISVLLPVYNGGCYSDTDEDVLPILAAMDDMTNHDLKTERRFRA